MKATPNSVAVLQPSYLPWLGYFEQILSVEHFVFLDDVQFDKGGWRNRNRIWLGSRPHWLTVPVVTSGRFGQPLNEVQILPGSPWRTKHLSTVRQAYRGFERFHEVASALEESIPTDASTLADLNVRLAESAARAMGAECTFHRSSAMPVGDGRNERLLDICEHLGAREYVSGQAAKAYLNTELFSQRGIAIRWHSHNADRYSTASAGVPLALSYVHYACAIGHEKLGRVVRESIEW